MPNFVLFGQNERLTVEAASFRRVQPGLDNSGHLIGGGQAPYYEFINDDGMVVAMLNEYTYGNIVREDALRPNV